MQRDISDLRNTERLLKGTKVIDNVNNFWNRRGDHRGEPCANCRPMNSVKIKGYAAASGKMGER